MNNIFTLFLTSFLVKFVQSSSFPPLELLRPVPNVTVLPYSSFQFTIPKSCFLNETIQESEELMVDIQKTLPEWINFNPITLLFDGFVPIRRELIGKGYREGIQVPIQVTNGHLGTNGDQVVNIKTSFWIIIKDLNQNMRPRAESFDLVVPPIRLVQITNDTSRSFFSQPDLSTDYEYSFPENLFEDPDGDNLKFLALHIASGRQIPNWLKFDYSGKFTAQVSVGDVERSIDDRSMICRNETGDVSKLNDFREGIAKCVVPIFIVAIDPYGQYLVRYLAFPVILGRFLEGDALSEPIKLVTEAIDTPLKDNGDFFVRLPISGNETMLLDEVNITDSALIPFLKLNKLNDTFLKGQIVETSSADQIRSFDIALSSANDSGWNFQADKIENVDGFGSSWLRINLKTHFTGSIRADKDYLSEKLNISAQNLSKSPIRLPQMRITSFETEPFIFMEDIDNSILIYNSSRVFVNVTDSIGRKLPTWIQAGFVSNGSAVRFQAYPFEKDAFSFDSVLEYRTTENSKLKFRMAVVVDGHLPPMPKLEEANLSTVVLSKFTYEIPEDAFITDNSRIVKYQILENNTDWLYFDANTKQLSGSPSETGLFSVKVVANDEKNAFGAYTINISVTDSSSRFSDLNPWVVVLIISSLLLMCALSIVLIIGFFRYKAKEHEAWLERKQNYWNPRTENPIDLKVEPEEPNYIQGYLNYIVSLGWLLKPRDKGPMDDDSDDDSDPFHSSSSEVMGSSDGKQANDIADISGFIVTDDGSIEVEAKVGKAFHFAFPKERLVEKLRPPSQVTANNEPINPNLESTANRFRFMKKGSDLSFSESSYLSRETSSYDISDIPYSVSEVNFDGNTGFRNLKFKARSSKGTHLPGWLHFNPDKCLFFGIPYRFDKGIWKIELTCGQTESAFDDEIIQKVSEVFAIEVSE